MQIDSHDVIWRPEADVLRQTSFIRGAAVITLRLEVSATARWRCCRGCHKRRSYGIHAGNQQGVPAGSGASANAGAQPRH